VDYSKSDCVVQILMILDLSTFVMGYKYGNSCAHARTIQNGWFVSVYMLGRQGLK